MDAGQLRDRVTIQAETRTANGQGGYSTSWSNVATTPTVCANILGLSGDEALQAGIQRSVQQWRVIVRKRSDLTTKHRLVWGGVNLDIKSVMPLPDEPRAFTLLMCESGAVV